MYASKERNERERKRQVREKGANKREKEEEGSGGGRSSMNGGHWSHPSRTDRLSSFLIRRYVFTIVSYLIGVFIFATIVGQVGNVITNRNANRLEFERLLDGAKTYMRHHKVPGGMKRRVLRWYDYSWSRGRIQGGGDINTALGLLPDKLKTELALHVNLSVLKKVTIFQVSRFPPDSFPRWINSTPVFVQVHLIQGTSVSAVILIEANALKNINNDIETHLKRLQVEYCIRCCEKIRKIKSTLHYNSLLLLIVELFVLFVTTAIYILRKDRIWKYEAILCS